MRLWIDDIRPAPDGYTWCKSVDAAKLYITQHIDSTKNLFGISEINLDYDAGNYISMGGDYIELLKWLEEKRFLEGWMCRNTVFHIHSMNPIGAQNMRAIIQYNCWKEN